MRDVIRNTARWPLFAVAAASALIVVARMQWPNLLFDSQSLILVAIAAGALALCYLPVKRLKFGDLEMEIERLQEDISSARRVQPGTAAIDTNVPGQVADLLVRGVDNPEGVFLSLCAAMEVKARELLGSEAGQFLSLEEAVKLGVQRGLFSPEALPAVRQFWRLKELVVRDRAFNVSRAELMSLISSQIELLKLISADTVASRHSHTAIGLQ